MKFRVIYFGTPVFAATVLKDLVDSGVHVVAVVTRPDKPQKRSNKLIPSPVKEVAQLYDIPLLQPDKASSSSFIESLCTFSADVFLVVAYGAILRQQVLDIPKLGCYNLHAGLLPQYRGAAPIQRCIMDGVTESGNTVIRMDAGMDSGDIVQVCRIPVGPDMTAGELAEALAAEGAAILQQTLQHIKEKTVQFTPQNHSLATLAPKLTKEDGQIDWNRTAFQIYAQIRGCTPAPGAWTLYFSKNNTHRLLVHKAALHNTDEMLGKPGTVIGVDQQDLIVACARGAIRLCMVQPENRRAMHAKEFFNGYREADFHLL